MIYGFEGLGVEFYFVMFHNSKHFQTVRAERVEVPMSLRPAQDKQMKFELDKVLESTNLFLGSVFPQLFLEKVFRV
jgi:hypothetical protein